MRWNRHLLRLGKQSLQEAFQAPCKKKGFFFLTRNKESFAKLK